MGTESLDNLARMGKLKIAASSKHELAGLIRSGRNRLADAQNKSLSIESRFDLAYNAAHALSLAALRAKGFRAENRYLVFQCLRHTVELPNEQWRVLDKAHQKRNVAESEGEIDIDEQLLDALIRVAGNVCDRLSALEQS